MTRRVHRGACTRSSARGAGPDTATGRTPPPDAPRRRGVFTLTALAASAAAGLTGLTALGGCVSIGGGGDQPQQHLRLHDPGLGATQARPRPLVPTLLIQPQPGDALADSTAIAFSDAPQRFGFYQYAFWTERPVRQLPRLLQQRLEARRVAGAVGLIGDPLRADWLLTLRIDTLHHDVTGAQARLALTVELFDRRSRQRVASRQVDAATPVAEPASAAAAAAMAMSVARCFDDLLPWLEAALGQGPSGPGAAADDGATPAR